MFWWQLNCRINPTVQQIFLLLCFIEYYLLIRGSPVAFGVWFLRGGAFWPANSTPLGDVRRFLGLLDGALAGGGWVVVGLLSPLGQHMARVDDHWAVWGVVLATSGNYWAEGSCPSSLAEDTYPSIDTSCLQWAVSFRRDRYLLVRWRLSVDLGLRC